jgi:hypothetical protein
MGAFLLRPGDRYNYISYVKIDDNWWEFDSLSAGPRRKSHRGAGYQQGYELDNVTILNVGCSQTAASSCQLPTIDSRRLHTRPRSWRAGHRLALSAVSASCRGGRSRFSFGPFGQ